MAAFVRALSPERQGRMRETNAKEGEHSIAVNNTHRRSAVHTDRRFCQQDPRQMEPAYRNRASAQVGRGGGEVEVGGYGCGKAEGTNEVICCCLAVSYKTRARFANTYAWTTEILT
jgi:hypothetical protein